MKKFIMLFSFVLLPVFACADTPTLNIICPNTVVPYEVLKCGITSSGVNIKSLELDYSISGGKLSNLNLNDKYTFTQSDNNIVIDSNNSTNNSIGTFYIKVLPYGKVNFNITNIKVIDYKYNVFKMPSVYNTSRILSNNSYLKSLKLSIGEIDFNKDKFSYEVETTKNKINIDAVTSSSLSTVSGAGEHPLSIGKNVFKISIISESGNKNVYEVIVNRKSNADSDCSLKSLSLSKGDINFSKGVTLYNVNVNKKIKSIDIDANLNNSKSSFVDEFGPRNIKLNLGSNKIYLKSESIDGSRCTYTLNITRGDDNSSDNTLKSLKISSGNLLFDESTSEYIVFVSNNVEDVKIDAKANTSSSKIDIVKPEELVVGENIIKINVTSEMRETRTYTIKVIRKKYNNLNNDAGLKKLDVGYKIDFKSNKYNYNIVTNKISSLNIVYKTNDKNASVTILGNEKLKNNSVIDIVVMAEDGSVKTYRVKVNQTLFVRKIMIISYFGLFIIYLWVIYYKNKGVDNEKKVKTKSKR